MPAIETARKSISVIVKNHAVDQIQSTGHASIRLSNSLQGTAKTLEYKIATDKVKHGLIHRPSKEELIEQDILLERKMDDSIQATASVLEKKILQDILKKKLERRPSKSELEHVQVLREFATELAPSLQAVAVALEMSIHKDKVNGFLRVDGKRNSF